MEVLCSPVNGRATRLENVHDEMFSEKCWETVSR